MVDGSDGAYTLKCDSYIQHTKHSNRFNNKFNQSKTLQRMKIFYCGRLVFVRDQFIHYFQYSCKSTESMLGGENKSCLYTLVLDTVDTYLYMKQI